MQVVYFIAQNIYTLLNNSIFLLHITYGNLLVILVYVTIYGMKRKPIWSIIFNLSTGLGKLQFLSYIDFQTNQF